MIEDGRRVEGGEVGRSDQLEDQQGPEEAGAGARAAGGAPSPGIASVRVRQVSPPPRPDRCRACAGSRPDCADRPQRLGQDLLLAARQDRADVQVGVPGGGGGDGGRGQAGDRRQVEGRQGRAGVQDQRPLDHVAQLPDVSGPAVGHQVGHDLGEDRGCRPPHGGGDLARESLHQQRDVLRPLAQRRQLHAHHVQTVEEILAEALVGDQGVDVAVGGRDHPHVDPRRPLVPDPIELAVLQDPQDLGLGRQRHVADLVHEQRPPVRQPEPSLPVGHRTGERAAPVPEELALPHLHRDRGAVDAHVRPLRPAAQAMDHPADELLAGPRFPQQQDGRGAGGHGADQPHRLHPGAGAPERLLLRLLARAQVLDLALQRPGPQGALERHLERLRIGRLQDVIGRPRLDALDRGGDRPLAGEDDDRDLGVGRLDLPHQVETVAARHAQVGQDHVDGGAGERTERLGDATGELHVEAALPEKLPERGAHVPLVLHHQDAATRRHPAGSPHHATVLVRQHAPPSPETASGRSLRPPPAPAPPDPLRAA